MEIAAKANSATDPQYVPMVGLMGGGYGRGGGFGGPGLGGEGPCLPEKN